MRDAIGAQPVRLQNDLVLAHRAAERRDLCNIWHGLELIFQEPILDRPQLRKIMFAGAIDECVLVHPADTGRIGTEGWRHTAG